MFATVTRLASTVGLGISTTVFVSAGGSTAVSTDVPWRPYQATFWASLVGAVIGLTLTPFLTIGRQGHRSKTTGCEDGKREGDTTSVGKHASGVV